MSALMLGPALIAGLITGGLFGVKGNGEVKEEAREVPSFSGVAVSGGIVAELREGEPQSLKVIVDENLLPHVETKVVDGVLEIRTTERLRPTKGIRVVVVAPRLERLTASGGARLEAVVGAAQALWIEGSGGATVAVTGISTDALKLSFSGGAKVRLEGKARTAQLSASGGVKLDAARLELDEAQVELSGGVNATLAARNAVAGGASGGVTLTVIGEPEVMVKTSGGSKLKRQ